MSGSASGIFDEFLSDENGHSDAGVDDDDIEDDLAAYDTFLANAGREQPARLPYPAHIDVAHHSRSRGPAAGAGAAGVAPSVLLRQGEERARGKAAAARQKEELGGGQQVACGVGSGEGEAVPERAVDERGRGGEPRIQGLREGERGCKELGGERGGEVASRRVDPACLGFRV